MKKIYTLFILLLTLAVGARADVLATENAKVELGDAITSLDDITDGKLYVLQNYGIASISDANVTETQKSYNYYSEPTSGGNLTFTNNYSYTNLVKFEGNSKDGYYIKFCSGNYLDYPTSKTAAPTTVAEQPSTKFTIEAAKNASGGAISNCFFICASTYRLSRKDNGTSTDDRFNPYWQEKQPWPSAIRIYPATVKYTVTWQIVDADNENNILKTLASATAEDGTTVTSSVTLPSYPYTTLKYNDQTIEELPEVTVNGTTTVNIKASFSGLPFTASTDESSHWYYLKNAGRAMYLYYNETNTNISADASIKGSFAEKSRYLWAFYGNPIEGYQIKNMYTDKYVTASEIVSFSNYNSENNPDGYYYGDGKYIWPTLTDNEQETAWTIVDGSSTDTNGNSGQFSFMQNNCYWHCAETNKSGDKNDTDFLYLLAFYSGFGAGSHWTVEEETGNADYSELENEYKAVNGYSNATIGQKFGQYNATNFTKDDITNSLTKAKELIDDQSNTNISYQKEIDNASYKLLTIYEELNGSLVMPTSETYLRIKSSDGSKKYLAASKTAAGTETLEAISSSDDNFDLRTIWYYDGTGLLSYSAGLYLTCITTSNGQVSVNSSKHNVAFASSEFTGKGTYYIRTDYTETEGIITGGRYLNLTSEKFDSGSSIHDSNDNPVEGYAVTLEEVTELPVTLNKCDDDFYYGTLYLPKNVSIPDGTTAYTATVGASTVTLTPITTESDGTTIIPDGNGVVLRNETGSIKVTTTNSKGSIGTNALTGKYVATQIGSGTSTDYYLGQVDTDNDNIKEVGFFQTNYSSSRYFTNKAYLPSSAATNKSKGFTFVFGDDDPTGISSATGVGEGDAFDADAVRYNVQGQRVPQGYKGIVIINGKKYLIK